MNPENEILIQIKENLVGYIEYCYNKKISFTPQYLIETFLFDNITQLGQVVLNAKDKEYIKDYSNLNNIELERFMQTALSLFVIKINNTRQIKSSRYRVTSKNETTIESIFSGLTYSGNNDSSYNNNPSALELATFKI